MSIISTGTVTGHEARGTASIVTNQAGGAQVQLNDFWIAPGAPDVRLYVSQRTDGVVDDTATELGKLPDHQPDITRDLPTDLDPAMIGSVIIQCTVYNVLFGYGALSSAA